ncbi:MAG: DUF3341 domain-containing protein [Bdellovibrionales bacterium]|nr:DUF3341 domain-containing protein [Bdellovibrionales bacterium]
MVGPFKTKRHPGVVGFFDNEDDLLVAAKKAYEGGYRKFDTISPFPIHGMDDAMGLKRSPLPWVTFTFGFIGCAFAVWLQWWTSAVNYPLNIGGKPMFSLPAFIPVTFELTVLLAGLSSFAAVLVFCKLPQINPPILDPDLTSHKFALFIPSVDPQYSEDKCKQFLSSTGAKDVRTYSEF